MGTLTPGKFLAITRYRFGLRTLRPSDVPRITTKDYGYVLARWAAFERWHRWKDRGGPRPADVWTRVPAWDGWTPWDLRRELLAKRKADAPKPGPGNWAGPRNVVLCTDPSSALALPRGTTACLTADPAYAHPDPGTLGRQLRDAGIDIAAWCVPTEVSVERLHDYASTLLASFLCGQCETKDQFDRSLDYGLTLMAGNLDELRGEQRDLVQDGVVQIASEDYWSAQPWLVPNHMGLPVTTCVGLEVDDRHKPNRKSLVDYLAAGRFPPGAWVYGSPDRWGPGDMDAYRSALARG